MDDFLYNLRTGNLRRGEGDHRQGRGSHYKGPQRRNGGDRRQMKNADLEGISGQLAAIEKNLKQIANEQRRIADAAEREADTLDLIAHFFRQTKQAVPDTARVPSAPSPSAPASSPATPSADPKLDREATLALIRDLRAEKMSYAKIAEHLEARGIATFSGRGKWYANTVSKLLQTGG
jgi:hypothetical protein